MTTASSARRGLLSTCSLWCWWRSASSCPTRCAGSLSMCRPTSCSRRDCRDAFSRWRMIHRCASKRLQQSTTPSLTESLIQWRFTPAKYILDNFFVQRWMNRSILCLVECQDTSSLVCVPGAIDKQ